MSSVTTTTSSTRKPMGNTTLPYTTESTSKVTKYCHSTPTDLVFVLHESGRVGKANFQLQNQFVAKLVEGFDIGINSTQVAVITFASTVITEFYLNAFNDKIQLLESIKHINYSHPGLTITHKALRTVRNEVFTVANGMRPNALPFVIVVTNVYIDELRAVATDPKDVIIVKDFRFLVSIQERALRSACKALLRNTNVSSNETETTILITTKHTIATTSSPTKITKTMTAITTTTTSSTTTPKEIITLPYTSESTIKFVAKLVEGFDIGINNTQVAVITFASTVVTELYLNAFHDKIQLLESIKHINYSHPGITMTHKALRTIRNDVFTVANGMRPDAFHFVIVLTNGRSMISPVKIREAKLLHELNITVFAFGISNEVYIDELRAIATVIQEM
uniref:VWFA domain-containing protein n=1 Tax=Magallana gigas TaxID=29159 RepID=A0A8W8I8F7_MAGGI